QDGRRVIRPTPIPDVINGRGPQNYRTAMIQNRVGAGLGCFAGVPDHFVNGFSRAVVGTFAIVAVSIPVTTIAVAVIRSGKSAEAQAHYSRDDLSDLHLVISTPF